MDLNIANLAPDLARLIGVQPTTMLLLLVTITKVANILAKRIPDDAPGWLGTLRKVCAVVGLHTTDRVTAGVSIKDVAKAALDTSPIPEKVAEAAEMPAHIAEDLGGGQFSAGLAKAMAERERAIISERQPVPGVHGEG